MRNILLKAMLAFAGFLRFSSAPAQTGSWIWVNGSSTTNLSATSTTPGSRDSQAYWSDASGNFWVFGGEDYNNNTAYNDLWEYSSNQWTRVSANSTSSGVPSARYAAVGVADHQGNFWIFGGSKGSACYNDLWEYNPTAKTWSHMSGSTSANATTVYSGSSAGPGARCYAAAAVDGSGNIWLFGGQDQNGNDYNDLWKYSTSSGQWTFVSGTKNTTNNTGVYSGGSTAPGARNGHCLWIDASQNIWVFGGQGYDNNANDGVVFLNDLWEYSSSKWSWKSGSESGDNKGVYGTRGTQSSSNVPGSRWGASGMQDASGAFWVFGGTGYATSTTLGDLNDLWSYDPANNQWTWVGGSNAIDASPTFGTQGVVGSSSPGGLQGASGWVDATGNIWIMAGDDVDNDDYNDLWEITPPIILPFTTVTLEGTSQGLCNDLSWQTVNEINTSSFIVERSTDGTHFTDIGSVPAVGSGNNSYSFTDAAPPQTGNSYYRLEMPHSRGDTTYSSIVVLVDKGGNSIVVYPNPTPSGVTLKLGGDALLNTPVKWYDAGGHPVREQLITSQAQYFDLHGFAAGIYLLQLEDGTTIRIVRE
jgi:Galactose oxidase, central domain/Kelch motif/Secretion system C-terminal sorting domain